MKKILILLFLSITFSQLNAQTNLLFSQDWSNASLITTNDNWPSNLSITGYIGDFLPTSSTSPIDPRTLLGDNLTIDVVANQTAPNTNTSGGVAEFESTFSVVALQGSGTADAPFILFNVQTSGNENIFITYTLKDIDGSTDNSIQPIVLQYRIGNSGNFTNVSEAYVADASTGPSLADFTTTIGVYMPSSLNNQSLVQFRILTGNASGSDEWIGIDNISVTGTTIITPPSSANTITGFTLAGVSASIMGNMINVTVPSSTNLANVVAYGTISPLATVNPAFASVTDFSSLVNFTVTAEDLSTNIYTVNAYAIPKSTAKSITGFTLAGVSASIMGSMINVTVPASTDLTNVVAEGEISPLATVNPSFASITNFSSAATFTVTSENLDINIYTVNAVNATQLSSECSILGFNIENEFVGSFYNPLFNQIYVVLPFQYPLTALTATGIISPGATVMPSFESVKDYTSPVLYTVTAENLTSFRVYEVIAATYIGSSENSITGFSVGGQVGTTTISGNNIFVKLPFGASLVGLTPLVTVSAFANYSPTTATDFTNVVNYVVTAQGGQLKTYNVSISNITGSSAKAITAFNILQQSGLTTIAGTTISLNVPFGTSLNALTATGTISSLATVNPSFSTAINYSSGFVFTVTAQDLSKEYYSVSINVLPEPIVQTFVGQVFFSEYIEVSTGNAKFIELFNSTNQTIDLLADGYTIVVFSNGANFTTGSKTTTTLTGTISPFGTYFIGNTPANNTTVDGVNPNQFGSNFYNGDDAIGLFKNGVLIDVIGQIGLDPGTEWNVNGVSTLNQTIRRKSNICSGFVITTTAFDPSLEWENVGVDIFSGLGSHNNLCSNTPPPTTPGVTFAGSTMPISQIRNSMDANGLSTITGEVTVEGRIYGFDARSAADQFEYVIIDNSGAGIRFVATVAGLSLADGDYITISGTLFNNRGQVQISSNNIAKGTNVPTRKAPTLVTSLSETTESDLIMIVADQFSTSGFSTSSSFNATFTTAGVTYTARFNASNAPLGFGKRADEIFGCGATVVNNVTIIGLGGQFNTVNSAPFNTGFQIYPYLYSDILVLGTVTPCVPPTFTGITPIVKINGVDASSFATTFVGTVTIAGQLMGQALSSQVGLTGGAQFSIVDESSATTLRIPRALYTTLGSNLVQGNLITVVGTMGQNNGLGQFTATQVLGVESTIAARPLPIYVTTITEFHEAKLIRVIAQIDSTNWNPAGGNQNGFNVNATIAGAVVVVRIYSNVATLFGGNFTQKFGNDEKIKTFTITGIGGQFDGSAPFNSGYQIVPYSLADFEFVSRSASALVNSFKFLPQTGLTTTIVGTVSGQSINVVAPYGISLTGLIPTIEVSDFANVVSTDAVLGVYNSGEQVFSQFNVTAQAGNIITYTVIAENEPNFATEVLSFKYLPNTALGLNTTVTGTVDGANLLATLPFGVTVTGLRPTLVLSEGARLSPNTTPVYTLFEGQYFGNITVKAQNNVDEQTYQIILTIAEPVSTKGFATEAIEIYPNPSTGEVSVKASIGDLVEVFDIIGNSVTSLKTQTSISKLSISKSGVYFVKISTVSGKSITKKLIIE